MFDSNTEDEEFIVIKAGPPLPLRRPKPLKTSAVSPRSNSSRETKVIGKSRSVNDVSFLPQPINIVTNISGTPRPSSSKLSMSTPPPPLPNSSKSNTSTLSNLPNGIKGGKSKGPTTISSSSAANNGPTRFMFSQSRSPSPSATCSTLTLRSRPPTPCYNVESKVKQYIEQVKKFDEEQKTKGSSLRNKSGMRGKVMSLEDLYQIPNPTGDDNDDVSEGVIKLEEKLRQTLRIIKEKDEMIDKLRESCHELKLKWADAENRIDEMRFGFVDNKQQSQPCNQNLRRSSFSINNVASSSVEFIMNPKRSTSAINLQSAASSSSVNKATNTDNVSSKVDKSTVTESNVEKVKPIRVNVDNAKLSNETNSPSESRTTIEEEDELCNVEEEEEESGSRESNCDSVLEGKCSSWLEKVQNWKTELAQALESKDKDSCGDRDSGFRESGEVDGTPKSGNRCQRKSASSPANNTRRKSVSNSRKQREQVETAEPEPKSNIILHSNQEANNEINYSPVPISQIAAHFAQKQEEQIASARNSLMMKNPDKGDTILTLMGHEGFPTSGNGVKIENDIIPDYEGMFPSYSSVSGFDKFSSYQSHTHGRPLMFDRRSQSMDRMDNYLYDAKGDKVQAFNMEYRDLMRSLEKKFQTLHPLIDSTTKVALQTQRDSEILTKALRACRIRTANANVFSTHEEALKYRK